MEQILKLKIKQKLKIIILIELLSAGAWRNAAQSILTAKSLSTQHRKSINTTTSPREYRSYFRRKLCYLILDVITTLVKSIMDWQCKMFCAALRQMHTCSVLPALRNEIIYLKKTLVIINHQCEKKQYMELIV